jgi:hypothetical protein
MSRFQLASLLRGYGKRLTLQTATTNPYASFEPISWAVDGRKHTSIQLQHLSAMANITGMQEARIPFFVCDVRSSAQADSSCPLAIRETLSMLHNLYDQWGPSSQ